LSNKDTKGGIGQRLQEIDAIDGGHLNIQEQEVYFACPQYLQTFNGIGIKSCKAKGRESRNIFSYDSAIEVVIVYDNAVDWGQSHGSLLGIGAPLNIIYFSVNIKG
jgi:hypothetical protein